VSMSALFLLCLTPCLTALVPGLTALEREVVEAADCSDERDD
jgi:ABC-type proline/glycine betaine transport system permease subunit